MGVVRGPSKQRQVARFGVTRAAPTRHPVAKTRHSCRENASVSGVKLHETNPSEPQRNPDASPDAIEATANEPELPGDPARRPSLGVWAEPGAPGLAMRTSRGRNRTNPSNPGNERCEPPRELQNELEGVPPGARNEPGPPPAGAGPLSAGTAS